MKSHVANLLRRASIHARNGGFAGDMLKLDAAAHSGEASRELFRKAIHICQEECDSELAERIEKELNKLTPRPIDQIQITINGKELTSTQILSLMETMELAAEQAPPHSQKNQLMTSLLDIMKES